MWNNAARSSRLEVIASPWPWDAGGRRPRETHWVKNPGKSVKPGAPAVSPCQ